MRGALFQKVDCVLLKVADLEAGLRFYSESLGHEVIWRTATAVGLAMAESDAELVLHTDIGPEVDLLVSDLDEAVRGFQVAGGELVSGPFDLPIGKGAVVRDPFGNVLVMLDQSKGKFITNPQGEVLGVSRAGD